MKLRIKQRVTFTLLLAIAMLATLLTACNDDKMDVRTATPGLNIELPTDVKDLTVLDQRITFRNIASDERTVFTSPEEVGALPVGLYECSYEANVEFTAEGDADNESVRQKGLVIGNLESVELKGEGTQLTLPTYLVVDKDDFIFEEIFFAGTRRPSSKSYNGDSYFKIYNNTDHVLYADGLAFVESRFRPSRKFDYQPDIRKDTMAVWSVYVVPGSGKDHPVQPGESMIICDTGIDHKNANPYSFDLSSADFEWYDISTSPSNMDIDSPTVPNMDKYYCYTLSFYILHNRGFSSFALARIPVGKEQYLKKYRYEYTYLQVEASGTYPMSGVAYKIANDWIVDGVNCAIQSKHAWNILPPVIDSGWTHCGLIDSDPNRFFHSVRRKMLYLTPDGRRKLKDTNNSTADFNTECVASEIEEQGTVMDLNGTKCTQRTYDGVQPIK